MSIQKLTNQNKATLFQMSKVGDMMGRIWFDHDAELANLREGKQGSLIVARFATTANINLATTALTAIDGVTPVADDVVLVKNQTDASENGLYVASADAWTRLKDYKGNDVLRTGMVVVVSEGDAGADTQWILTTNEFEVDTDNIAFAIYNVSGVNSADLASTATNKGASLVGIEDSGTLYTATTVEAALAEAATNLAAHLTDSSDAHDASAVSVLDSAGLFTATDVEAALLELVKYIPLTLADPGTGQAIGVTRSATVNLTIGSSGAETNTLAIPSFVGQKMIINADTVGTGTRAITASQALNQTGNTVMTFAQARDNVSLVAIKIGGALRWQIASNDGVALS